MKVSECENYAIENGTKLKAVEVCDTSCEGCHYEYDCVGNFSVTKCSFRSRKDKKDIVWQPTTEKNAFFAENCKVEFNANEAIKLRELIDFAKINCDKQREIVGKIQYLIENNFDYGGKDM